MCGLVGIAGRLEYKDETAMKRMLVFDYFRGTDSTGFASLKKTGVPEIVKIASHPLDLMDMKKFSSALNGTMSTVWVGHNRAATKGAINAVNAHPYQYGHIVGAHNGTLEGTSWADLKKALGEDTETDSQAIFACIAKLGIEETMKHMQGAWALVWINLEDNTLNFLRNKERPLWYAWEKKFEKFFWASEWTTLQHSLRAGTSTQELYADETGYSYYAFETDMHYKYDINLLKEFSQNKTATKPVVKELKGREPAPVHTYHYGTVPFVNRTQTNQSGQYGTNRGSCGVLVHKDRDLSKIDNFPVVGSDKSPWGIMLDEYEFKNLTQHKCSWCKEEVSFHTKNVIVYKTHGLCLGPCCSGLQGNYSKLVVDKDTIESAMKKADQKSEASITLLEHKVVNQ